MSELWELQVFDPADEFSVVERKLPHWTQAGTLCFITWRTVDSIPTSILPRWHADRENWLLERGINPKSPDWREAFERLDAKARGEFVRTFSDRWHRQLDSCHGESVLKQPELSKNVHDSLLHFDGDRYEITDFVVMPNHVHLIAAFLDEAGMLDQCEGWKHYQATQVNRMLGTSGRFWQQDGFDHLIRSIEQLEALRRYIAANPIKANLKPGQYRHYSKR